MKLITVAAVLGALAYNAQALRPPPPVSDYISEDGRLGHCNDPMVKNVGNFGITRVRCGCNDDEEKVGRSLGYKHLGYWRVGVYTANCVPEGTADEGYVCTKRMPKQCEKPGVLPEKCDRCHCSCSFVSAERQPFPGRSFSKRSLRSKVPQQACPAGEEWDLCATSLCNNERKCGDERSFPARQDFCRRARVACGKPGCTCESGLVRDNKTGRCVPREYC